MNALVWRCGHPRTIENTQKVGCAGVRCRECRRKLTREWERAHRSVAARKQRADLTAAAQ